MEKSNKKMKRVSVNSDKSHAVDGPKLKYQTLLMEYLELQKVFVSKKNKLQAAKQKRETVLAEVRFLRRRHKYLLRGQAQDADNNAVEGGRNQSTSKASLETSIKFWGSLKISVSVTLQKDEEGEGNVKVLAKKVKIPNNRRNSLTRDKVVAKRKISWPDKVTH